MNLIDNTKNQHFVSQYDQRLNACNPGATKKNQRIFEHHLVNRDAYDIRLKSRKGVLIENSLSLHDLFSFDVVSDGPERYNFEGIFGQYEAKADEITQALRAKITQHGCDVSVELVEFFKFKFLNFVRNPFSLRKMLNSFPGLRDVQPTDPVHQANFLRVINGRKPHQRHLCEKLGISDGEYQEWLSTIFLLLTPLGGGGSSMLDVLIEELFESPEYYRMIFIYTYTDHACLLSDRGFSQPSAAEDLMAFDFNFFSNGFVRFAFQNIESQLPSSMSARAREKIKSGVKTEAHHYVDDLEMLKHYNRHVVYQCHNRVFSSSPDWYCG